MIDAHMGRYAPRLLRVRNAEVTFVVDWEGGLEWFCTFNCGPRYGAMTGMIVAEDRR